MRSKNFRNSTDKICKIETNKTSLIATKCEISKTRVLHLQQSNNPPTNQQQFFLLAKPLTYVTHTTAVAATTNDRSEQIKTNYISYLYYQLLPQFPMKSNYNYLSFKITHFLYANCRRQFLTILIATLILLSYCVSNTNGAPHSCTLCDKNDLKAKDPQSSTYEEFLFEHQVTRNDAINALKKLNESFFQGSPLPDNSCKSIECTKTVMKYCAGALFINDHCWCEFGHIVEGLPFVPHICYIGEKLYKASVDSCFIYEQLKECCCAAVLAKQWRHISGNSSLYKNFTNFLLCSFSIFLIFFNYIFHFSTIFF